MPWSSCLHSLLVCGAMAGCGALTNGVRLPSEVAGGDWSDVVVGSIHDGELGQLDDGSEVRMLVVTLSDREDVCLGTGPGGELEADDIRAIQVVLITPTIEARRYVPNSKIGPGSIDSNQDVAMTASVSQLAGGERLVWARPETEALPLVSLDIYEVQAGLPTSGRFEFRVVSDRGTAREADVDDNGDGRPEYRALDHLVSGSFDNLTLCGGG